MKDFTHMSCLSIRMFETIFSSSKTMQAYLIMAREMFASWPCHTQLTSLPGPNPSLIDHPWDNLDWWVHDCIPSQPPHFPDWNTIGNASHMGWGRYIPRLLLSMRKRLIECILKGCSHTRYELQYITLIFYWPFQGGTSFVDPLCFCSVLCLLCFVRVCLYVLCGHLLGKGWPLGSRLWCLLWVCHFPIGILGQVWYLIVSIPDLCTITYFVS